MTDYALGIPSKDKYGDLNSLQVGEILDYYLQRHDAERAGTHDDLRFGTPDMGLHSWAVPKLLPKPGDKVLAIRQPTHSHSYGSWAGKIDSGYGKGLVKSLDTGKLVINNTVNGNIFFSLIHKKQPERFVLVKPTDANPKNWLLINVTPTKPHSIEKVRYVPISKEELSSTLETLKNPTVQAKVDGASSLVQLLNNKLDLVSLRAASKTGYPIVHAERVLGRVPSIAYDKSIDDTVLKGEVYGVNNKGKPIPLQLLSGMLNSAPAKAIAAQRANDIKMKVMLYDIARYGGKNINLENTPYADRQSMLNEIAKLLPQDVFHVADSVKADKAKALYDAIERGKHPLTSEGIVIHPEVGKPRKLKTSNEYDVYVTSVYPGEGKYTGSAGGFNYSLEPGGKEIGRVGTGFDDQYRKFIWDNQQDFTNQKIRIASPEQLASGAYRHPVFLSTHEG